MMLEMLAMLSGYFLYIFCKFYVDPRLPAIPLSSSRIKWSLIITGSTSLVVNVLPIKASVKSSFTSSSLMPSLNEHLHEYVVERELSYVHPPEFEELLRRV